MKSKFIIYYYIISIIMMANDAFFTWLGMVTHINFWRQLITLIGFYIVYKTLRTNEGLYYIRKVCRQYGTMFKILAFFSILTIVFNGYTLDRVLYALWIYSFGIPFLLFPYYTNKCGWSDHKFNMLFIYLGVFLSVGILADFLSGGLFTTAFLLVVTQGEGDFEAGRFCFLSTGPTVFTVYYCFCLFCLMSEIIKSNGVSKRFFLLLISFLFIFGSIFCGSRQTLVALLMVEIIGLWTLFKTSKMAIIILFMTVGVSYLFLPQARDMLSRNQGFQDRYSTQVLMEDERSKTWKKGLNDCIIEPTIRRVLIGDGVGRTISRGALPKDVGSHYENTFFARISDVGWIMTFWMLLLPVHIIIKYRKNNKMNNLLYIGVIGSYLFICLISPNGATPTTQMALFILLGKFLEGYNYGKRQIIMAGYL